MAPLMIDWITCRIPVTLPAPIAGGYTVILDRNANTERTTPHRLPVAGSFASTLSIRAVSRTELEISGNPLKWMQGHNLWGTSDLRALLWATLQRLEPQLGCTLAEAGLYSAASLDDTIITRIDVTAMLCLASPGDVLAWLRAAHATATAGRRGRSIMKGSTLVFGDATGKSFARWQIVLYAKGDELEAHPLPPALQSDMDLRHWANRCLRAELRLGRLELSKRGFRTLDAWAPELPGNLWREKMGSLTFSETHPCDDDLASLPQHLRGTYALWKQGCDLRSMLARATFFRQRAELLRLTGVDLAVAPPASTPTARIVPIKRTLEAVPAGRPPFADRIDAIVRAHGGIVFSDAA